MTNANRANGAPIVTPDAGTRTSTIHHITLTACNGQSTFAVGTPADDLLTQKAAQLRSLLLVTQGARRDAFMELHAEDQDNILWLAQELATEINLLAEVLAGGGAA